jgi:ComEC/Rec2-related protein
MAPRIAPALVAVSALLLGMAMRFEQTVEAASRPRLDIPQDGQLMRAEATVASSFAERGFAVDILSHHLERPPRFGGLVVDVELIDEDGNRQPLGDPTALLSVTVVGAPPDCRVADRIGFVGVARGTGAQRLPDDVRMIEASARRGVVGSVAVDSPELVRVIDGRAADSPFAKSLARLRDSARERVRAALLEGVPDDGDVAIRAMLVALVLGDAEDGYRTIENSFRAVGLSHILAISGFNLAVLGWIVGLAARVVSSDVRVHALACGAAAVGALVLMAPAASATRAALMAAVGASGHTLGRDWNGDAVLAVAAIAMLVASPSEAVGPGFQLSFACVIALRHLAGPIHRRWLRWMPRDDPRRGHPAWLGLAGEFLARAVASGLAAFVASVPIVLAHFGSLQPYGTALTLLCAPLSTMTLVLAYPKAILAAVWPPLLGVLGWPLHLAAWLQVELVELAIRSGAGSIAVGGVHWSLSAAIALASLVAFCAARRIVRAWAWLALATLLLVPPLLSGARREAPHFDATMFAIGDGTSIAIESGPSLVLFDGGSSSIGNVASRALLPWIEERGGSVEAVFISHADLDHLSALADVARYARIGRVLLHDSMLDAERSNPAVAALLKSFRDRGVSIETTGAGDSLRIGRAVWTVIWPSPGFRSKRDNDMSLVISVEVDALDGVPRPRLLLCGDIETEPAARLSAMHARGEVDLRCDVLELPHHGSWREAVAHLLSLARPQLILQSTAARRFSQDRFATHLPSGSMRLVTCRDGTLRVSFGSDGVIRASVVDAAAADGMRPAGRTTARRKPRRIRVHWRRSALPDEARPAERDSIAADAVATVLHDDLQAGIGRDAAADANGPPAVARVEDHGLGRGCTKTNGDRDPRVDGRGFGERDVCREHGFRADKGAGHLEQRVHGAVKLDRPEAEQRLLRWLRARRWSTRIAIRRLGRSMFRCFTRRKGRHRRSIEQEGARSRHGAAHRLWIALRNKIRIGKHETPARLGVEGDALRTNDRSIGGPEKRVVCRRLFERSERYRGDAIKLDPPSLGLLRGCVRCVLASCGLGGRADVVTRTLDHQLLADRIDEPDDDIAVLQKDGVGIGSTRCTASCHEPDLGGHIGVDGNRADPPMLPTGLSDICAERAGKQLAVSEDKGSGAHLSQERHGPVGLGADETRDDIVGLDLGSGGAGPAACLGHADAFGAHSIDASLDPLPVSEKHLQSRASRRVRGLRRSARGKRRARIKQHSKRKHGCAEEWSDEFCRHAHRRYRVVLPLEDRKIALRHLKHDQRHRGAVRVTLRIRPGTVGILLRKQLVADRRPPGLPSISAREIHRLHGVVVTVEVVGLREASRETAATARKCRLLEIVKAALDGLVFVDACVEQARDARSRTRPGRTPEVLHVAEAAIGVLTGTDIANRVVDRRLRDLDAGVSRAAERHHLADRDRHVRVVGNRVVAPSTLVVLTADDQLHRSHERIANPIVLLIHAVDLSEEERRESVAVHRSMRLVGNEKPGLGRVVEDEVEGLLHALAELTAARQVSVRHEADRAKTRHADMLAKAALAERAVGLLLTTQILEAPADRILESWRDLRIARRVLGAQLGKTGRRCRSGFTWVRGHWRRNHRGRAGSRGVNLRRRREESEPTAAPKVARSQRHTRQIAIVMICVILCGIRWIRRRLGCAEHERSTVEGRPKGWCCRTWLIRKARAPPRPSGGRREVEQRRQRHGSHEDSDHADG